jgi:hypothetical protein
VEDVSWGADEMVKANNQTFVSSRRNDDTNDIQRQLA